MKYQTIEEVYAANDKIRAGLLATIGEISDEQATALPDGEKWTIAQIVEHIAIVQNGMTRISAKLLNEAKANGKTSDGTVRISDDFSQKAAGARAQKFEAPDRVRPTGNQTIAESIEKLKESEKGLKDLQPMFETVECSDHKFPHPAFGDLTAHEWLALVGGHEFRHLEQIKKRLG
ncbi:hypothetical protein BH20ACI4_BH20ACI4_17880 [soil metagenome]